MTVNRVLWKAIGYEPHPKQLEFHASTARFKVAVCGRRFGKSRMAAAEVEPLIMQPGTRGWIVGPEYKIGEKEFRYIWDDLIVKMKLGPQMKRKAYNVRTGEMYIETPWGSRVDVMSADHPDSLVGEGLDWVIVSEAAKQRADVWEKYLRPALADKHGTAIFPSTPEGFNWFYERYQEGQAGRHHEWESWQYPSWENPYVYPDGFDDAEVQSQLRTPNDAWFWQELGADFRSVVGLVYPEWDEEIHVKKHTFNPAWENYHGYDFGYTNPYVCLDIQVSPSEDIYVWREYYEAGNSRSKNAHNVQARPNPEGYRRDGGFGDSADPDAIQELCAAAGPTIGFDTAKDWMRGVQEVKEFLRTKEGHSRLFVDPSCVNTISEFNGYRIKPPTKRGDPGANLKEEADKRLDHCMDALRYFVMHKFVLGADSHLDKAMVEATLRGEDSARGLFTWDDRDGITLGASQW